MRLLKSPSAMTWAAQAVRMGGFLLVLPAAVRWLPSGDVSVWLLLATITSYQLIFDFGITPTFSREFAYGFAGGSLVQPGRADDTGAAVDREGPNWLAIGKSVSALRWIYRRLSAAYCLLMLVFGTWAILGPIQRMANPIEGWIAWLVVLLASPVSMYGNVYSSILTGANRIHLIKRWELLTTGISLGLQMVMLHLGCGIVGVVLAAQAGALAFVVARRRLADQATTGLVASPRAASVEKAVVAALWPASWRTAIGALMSYGVVQGIVIAAANVLAVQEAVAVQLATRIMQTISQISQVPFYSTLPVLNGLRARRTIDALLATATVSMRRSLLVFVIGCIATDLAVRPLLAATGGGETFPGHAYWLLLAFAYFFERVGAMHVNLLLTDNKAISHIANGVASIVWIAVLLSLWSSCGALAIPSGMLVAYAGFYAPWSAWMSHHDLMRRASWRTEARSSLLAFALLAAYAVSVTIMS